MKKYYHYKLGCFESSKKIKGRGASTSKGKAKKALIGLLVFVVAVFWWYSNLLGPVGGDAQNFVIDNGQTSGEVLQKLETEGFIKSAFVAKIYAVVHGSHTNFKAGEYSISKDLSTAKILDIVSGNIVVRSRFTIVGGKTLQEILPDLYSQFGQEQVDSVLINIAADFHPILADQAERPSVNLEGYILPETYTDLTRETTFESWLKRNFDLFEERIAIYKDGFAEQGFDLYEAFTLASIVQQESSRPEEQKKIAQVFELRLKKDISLGADPTFRYAAKITGEPASPNIDSPYNTRLYKGLPPGPIGTFELSALEAVAAPADGDFLFFVAGDDGTIHYTRTDAEHRAAAEKYCDVNCSL